MATRAAAPDGWAPVARMPSMVTRFRTDSLHLHRVALLLGGLGRGLGRGLQLDSANDKLEGEQSGFLSMAELRAASQRLAACC